MEYDLHTPSDGGIIANIRHMDVSCLESPYTTVNIHFSGPCDNGCELCHSKDLYEVKQEDHTYIKDVLSFIEERQESGLINGICILGTDNHEKIEAVNALLRFADEKGLVSVLYTGYSMEKARKKYGAPTWIIAGPYVSGEWHENKRFYVRIGESSPYKYIEKSHSEFFNSYIQ